MSHWNHRVIHSVEDGESYYAIHEVYYGVEGDGVLWTENPIRVIGESIDELRETLERMLACLDKPVIDDRVEQ